MMMSAARLFVTGLALASYCGVTRAAATEFDFKDPKKVNTISIFLDSKLEPIVGLASGISGLVTYDPAKPEALTGKIVVESKSIQFANNGLEEALHGPDWLDSKTNPEITFNVKKVEDVKKDGDKTRMMVTGDFLCKGVTKEIKVPVEATVVPNGAAQRTRNGKGDLLVLRSNFVVKRSDFKLKDDMGADIVADDMELRVAIVGHPKK